MKKGNPHDGKPAPQAHDGKCGAKKRQGAGRCTQVAGWGTKHPGIGRCKLHGGATPLKKDGRSSKVVHEMLAARVLEIAAMPDPADLNLELAFLRALRELWLKQWTEKPGDAAAFSLASNLTKEIGAMVDRIEKHQQNRGVSYSEFNRYLEQYGLEIAAALREAGISEADQDRFAAAFSRRIGALRPNARTVNVASLPSGT